MKEVSFGSFERGGRGSALERDRESSHLLPPSFLSWLSETSSMKVFDTITGIIYLVIAAIELGGFLAALKVSFVFLRPLCLSLSSKFRSPSHLISPPLSLRTEHRSTRPNLRLRLRWIHHPRCSWPYHPDHPPLCSQKGHQKQVCDGLNRDFLFLELLGKQLDLHLHRG